MPTYTSDTTYTADSMARKYGVTVDQLQALNPGHNIRAGIVRGAVINVPDANTALPTSSASSTIADAVSTSTASGSTPSTQNAADALTSLFNSYGLTTLSGEIVKMAQQGLGADSISLQLQQTDAYKQRFSANDARIKNGMAALTPAQYISTESAYRQIMSAAGLPVGFYDQQSDFTDMIAKDISPTELKGRVDAAAEAINQAPPETLDFARQWYGTGDLIAMALDPTKAAPLVESRIKAAEAAGLAARNKTAVSQALAEQLGAQGFSYGQLQQGFGDIGVQSPTAAKLNSIYGSSVTNDDLVKEVFLNDATATNKVKGLASQERAAFSGDSGTSKTSLANDAGGSF